MNMDGINKQQDAMDVDETRNGENGNGASSANANASATGDEHEIEEGTVEYRIIAGPMFDSNEERLFATQFRPSVASGSGVEEVAPGMMTKEEGNLGLGKWKIVNGLRKHNIEETHAISGDGTASHNNQKRTVSKHGGVSLSAKQSAYFSSRGGQRTGNINDSGWGKSANFTLQEVTSDIVGGGATMIAQRQSRTDGGSQYFMFYADESSQGTTFFARKVDDLYKCSALYTKPVGPPSAEEKKEDKQTQQDVKITNGVNTQNGNSNDEKKNTSVKGFNVKNLMHAFKFGALETDNKTSNKGSSQGVIRKSATNVGKLPLGYGDDDWEHDGAESDDDEGLGLRTNIDEVDGAAPNEDVEFDWNRTLKETQQPTDAEDILAIDYSDEEDGEEENGTHAKERDTIVNGENTSNKTSNRSQSMNNPEVNQSVGVKRGRDETNDTNEHRKKASTSQKGGPQTSHNITAEDVQNLLRGHGGSMSSRDLSKAFKARLLTDKDKRDFASIVKSVAKKTSNKDGTMISLK